MIDSQHATRLLGSNKYRFTHKGNCLSQSCMIKYNMFMRAAMVFLDSQWAEKFEKSGHFYM